MKNKIFFLISEAIASNKILWTLLRPFIQFAGLIQYQKDVIDSHFALPEVIAVLGDTKVKNGPFKGMEYPYLYTNGSTLGPKLIGSYEFELNDIIEKICHTNYDDILDIGCAEGYYAVGLAMRNEKAIVHAFDTDLIAKDFCHKMAVLNGVSDRIKLESFCSDEILKNFKFTTKSLIISDCEGYEMSLFNENNISNLSNTDLLIELHDFNNINTSGYIYDLFKHTHDIVTIESIDDIKKAKTYSFTQTNNLTLELKKKVFAEKRITIMEWYFMTPKK